MTAGQKDPDSADNLYKTITAVVSIVTNDAVSVPQGEFKNWHWDARQTKIHVDTGNYGIGSFYHLVR